MPIDIYIYSIIHNDQMFKKKIYFLLVCLVYEKFGLFDVSFEYNVMKKMEYEQSVFIYSRQI